MRNWTAWGKHNGTWRFNIRQLGDEWVLTVEFGAGRRICRILDTESCARDDAETLMHAFGLRYTGEAHAN